MEKTKSTTKTKILYAIFISVFTLLSFEALLRLVGVNKSWSEKVGHEYVSGYNWKRASWLYTLPPDSTFEVDQGEFKYTYTTNSLGIREKENPYTDSSAARIMCIGDSYTEGLGAPYDSTYPRFLENELNKRGFINQTYNAGVQGSDPFYGYVLLKQKLIQLKPQYVLMTFNSSDLTDYIFVGGMERFKPDGTVQYRTGPTYEKQYANSYLFRYIINNILEYEIGLFVKKKDFPSLYSEAVEKYIGLFDSINILAKENEFQFMVVIQPIASELALKTENNELVAKAFSEMENELTRRGILNVNMYTAMAGKITRSNLEHYSYLKDTHFNALGYKMFSDDLLKAIDIKYPLFFKSSPAPVTENK